MPSTANLARLYDDMIFGNLGEFGLFQCFVFVTCNLAETPAAWAMTMMSIAAVVPDWWSYELISSTNTTATMNSSSLLAANTISVQWRQLYQVCPRGANKTIYFDPNVVSIISEWNLICDRDWIPNTITTVQMVGVLVGAFIGGQMGDYFGRKKSFFFVYAMILAFTFVSAFSVGWEMFAVVRFMIGIGLGGFLILSFNLPLEYMGTSWRTVATMCPFWAIGVSLLAFFAWINDNWKTLSIGISCAGALLLLTWWVLPESVRWLLSHNRTDEAEKILKKMAKVNKRPAPDLSKLRELQAAEKMKQLEERNYTYLDLFKHMDLIKRVAILGLIWFTCTLTYYGLTFNVSKLAGSRYLNLFLFGFFEAIAILLLVPVSKCFGRKVPTIAYLGLSTCSAVGVVITLLASSSVFAGHLASGLAILARCFLSGAWASTMLFTAENFPTVVRTVGYGACSIAGRIGGVLAPQVIFLHKYGVYVPYLIYGIFLMLSCAGCLMLTNTYNDPLPDFIASESTSEAADAEMVPMKYPPSDNEKLVVSA